jgi:formylglycine-generating enzyme required for sulfatase activity
VPADEACPDDEAGREVDLRRQAKACTAMGVYEVSFVQYDYYVWSQRHLPWRERPRYPEAPHAVRGLQPVVNVSHDDAMGYARWLSQATGQTWRLPTEEEWEYAARAVHPAKAGGKEGPWWWGDEPPSINGRADCNGCDTRSDGTSAPIGSFKPNPFGIYDTVGNVSEWTSSIYTRDNRPARTQTPEAERVRRGGSWGDAGEDTRVSARLHSAPDLRYGVIGFRVCRE